jgi:hypothetical protein
VKLPVAAPPRGRFDAGRTGAGIALLCLAAAAAVVLGLGSVSAGNPHPSTSTSTSRTPAISDPQARSLAQMRYGNQLDGQVAFHADLGDPGSDVKVGGWIDWRRPLVYLASLADTPGPADGLVQGVPGLVAVHAGRPSGTPTVDGFPMPPDTPPVDGWRPRPLNPAATSGAAFDELVTMLFGLATDRPDVASQLVGAGARFVRRDAVSTVPVDVFTVPTPSPSPSKSAPSVPSLAPLSPLAPASSGSPSSLASASASAVAPSVAASVPGAGPMTYWLDDNSRLRRLDTTLGGDLPLRIDFDRTKPAAAPVAIELLGGLPVNPRPVTATEALMLAELPVRARAATGGTVTLTVPAPAGVLAADGWLDWRTPAAYFAVRDVDDPGSGSLLRADRTTATTRIGGLTGTATMPPLRPPSDTWTQSTWAQRAAVPDDVDLDTLLTTVLGLGSGTRMDPNPLRTTASWLRTDTVGTVSVNVFELRDGAETVPGQGLLRYWVDKDGLLRRLEVRTAGGGYGWLDLTPGPVPVLPKPTPKR